MVADEIRFTSTMSDFEKVHMLDLPGTGADPEAIDFNNLLHLPAQPAIVSDIRTAGGKRVHQHAYLAYFDGRFWAQWSDGPGLARRPPEEHWNVVPGHDRPDTRISYAVSEDGLNWGPVRDLSGPPKADGFGYIARGLWERDGELLALASHFNAPGYTGRGLCLVAWRWNEETGRWDDRGTVRDDALNNFPPKRLPSGEWMMSRRDHRARVTVLIGGVDAINQWETHPLAVYDEEGSDEKNRRPEEPYWYILPDGQNLVGLFRDNSGSKRLLRGFSSDFGRTWTELMRTNFPDARSKFFVLRTSRGYYALVSNANPKGRDPLTLSISEDGIVFTRMYYLVGGRHVDYPHMIEHDGHLFISYSSAKQTVEILKVPLDAVDRLLER